MKRGRSGGRARPDDPLASWCEAAVPGVCTGRATHRHHTLGRVGPGVHDRGSTLDLCRPCHEYVHAHPAESYERGWLQHRGTV